MLASEKLKAILEVVDAADARSEGTRNDPISLTGNDRQRIRQIRRTKPSVENAILKGYKKDAFVFAYCPICRKWHMHGHAEAVRAGDVRKGSRIGNWISHCRNEDAFQAYDVSLFTRTEIEAISRSLGHYPITERENLDV